MARLIDRLTARSVQAVRAPARPLLLPDGRGLYLRVWPAGSKSWIFRYQRDSIRHDIGLGPYPDITLATARERAAAQRQLLLNDADPIAARRERRLRTAHAAAAKIPTFHACAERYLDAHRPGWKHPKHIEQWERSLANYVYPVIGKLPVAAVDVGQVMQIVEPLWATKPETANRVRSRIEAVLAWATARNYRKGDNPARWRGHIENLVPRRSRVSRIKHYAALHYADVGAAVAALRQEDSIGALCLEFLILTVTRSSEARGAQWSEIDLEGRVWILPPERMKSGKEHRVPLCARALEILREMAKLRHSDFVFPGLKPGKPLTDIVLRDAVRRQGLKATPHGFRSSFSDWCAEQTNFPAEVREMALAHAVGDKVEAAYRRGDLFQKRRQVMDAWASYIEHRDDESVVRLRGRR